MNMRASRKRHILMNNIAVIVIGRLDIDDTFLKVLHDKCFEADLFICTDSKYRSACTLLSPRCTLFTDIVPEYEAIIKVLNLLPEGHKLIQWYRLKLAWKLVNDEEKIRGAQYDVLYKVRSDLEYSTINFNCFEEDNTLYANSDYIFGGRRFVMERAADFFDFALLNYYGKDSDVSRVDSSVLRHQDFSSMKFAWLNFNSSDLSKMVLDERYDNKITKRVIKRKNNAGQVYWTAKRFDTVFSSEKAFVEYIVSSGLTCRRIERFPAHISKNRVGSNTALSRKINILLRAFFNLNFSNYMRRINELEHDYPYSLRINIISFLTGLISLNFGNSAAAFLKILKIVTLRLI